MKIFLTIGTQAPFDRLVKIVDQWALEHEEVRIFGQIGSANYFPKNFEYCASLEEKQFAKKFHNSNLIISHAGMGTIITCCTNNKPILVLPRLKKYQEHRNNHQIDTVKGMSQAGFIDPCLNEDQFINYLNNYDSISPKKQMSKYASGSILEYLNKIIQKTTN